MKQIALMALALLSWPSLSQAHFLWLLTAPAGTPSKAKVYFSESAEPDDPALLDKVIKAEAWAVTGRGAPKPLELSKGADCLEAELNETGRQSPLILRYNYGVVTKGGDPFLLKYFAKTYPYSLPGTWRSVNDNERLPLEIVPSLQSRQTSLLVLWQGKPLPGSTITIVGPGIPQKIEGTTNESGIFTCELPQAGIYSIRAKQTDSTPGSFDGQAYQSTRCFSTLTLHHQPIRLTLEDHSFPALPKGVTSFGAAIVEDSLYLYGGNYGGAHEYVEQDQSGDLWKLSLLNPKSWEKVSTSSRRQGVAMVAYRGALYRIGGFEAVTRTTEKQNLISSDDFARWDFQSGSWQMLPKLPEPRSSHDAAIIGSQLYVVGGWNLQGGGATAKWHDTAAVLDLAAEKLEWKTIGVPFRRRALSIAAWNQKLVCAGGMTESGGPTTKTSIYDPANGQWSEGPSLIGTSMDGFGSSSFSCDGRLFVTTVSGSIQQLATDGGRWELAGQLQQARFFHRMISWRDAKLIVVGGASMEEGKRLALELIPVTGHETAAR